VRINDRRILVAMARQCGFAPDRHDSVFIALDKLDKVDRADVVKELEANGHPAPAIAALMSLLTHFEPTPGSQQSLAELQKRLAGHADEDAVTGLTTIIRTTSGEAGGHWRIAFDPTLVRGMSYYTGPIFEIGSSAFPSSIAGGGRYDDMIGKILGQPVPATGFSIGFERVVSVLMERGQGNPNTERRVALMFDEAEDPLPEVLSTARRLRAEGLAVSVEGRSKRLGAQLAALERHGFAGFAVFDGTPRPELRWFADRERSREVGEST
jgi:histidyl-tRNA synthetase